MKKITVEREDIKKAVYFISNLTQMQENHPMQGALSSKGDFMGGIFDRWINIIPEGILFNKCILPDVCPERNVEVITDYYDYSPKDVGIAPDVIGIRVDGRPIPFVVFNDEWQAVEEMPQIEVKTFKENQYMVSLRNQGYDDKYLVLALSSFDVDYLVPLMDHSLFHESIYQELHMDDSIFIVSNREGKICQPHKIDCSKTSIGTVELMKIAKSSDFMNYCNLCDPGITPEYVRSVIECSHPIRNNSENRPLLDFLAQNDNGLYEFNKLWYEQNDSRRQQNIITLNISVKNADLITVKKINKTSIYVKTSGLCSFAGVCLENGKTYKIEFGNLNRSGASHEEYFMNKSTVSVLPDCYQDLKQILKQIIRSV